MDLKINLIGDPKPEVPLVHWLYPLSALIVLVTATWLAVG